MVKVQLQKMHITFFLKNIFNFTGEMKSCSLNVKLLTIQSANFVLKQVGLDGANGANLQQVKLNIMLVIKVLATNNAIY